MDTQTGQKTQYRDKVDKVKDICKECIKEIIKMRVLKEKQDSKS